MDETQFRDILRLGLGRAILYARSHNAREFRDVILDASLHCYAYDIQVEGTRASYMHDLVSGLPDKEFYYAEVLKSLPGGGDNWDAAQRFHFAACLAFEGDEKAKRAMYDSYAPGPRWGELIGIEFLEMDGIPGLLFVAEKMGALLTSKPEDVDEGFLLHQSIKICGEQPTRDALCEAGAANPFIEKYRTFAAAAEHVRSATQGRQPETMPLKYEELANLLASNKPYLLWKWGEQASDHELELAAKALIAAKDSKQQLAHLRIFARRRFPLDVDALLRLVEIKEDRVGVAAMKALAHIQHPAVRALAFRLMDSRAGLQGEAIELLDQNYQDGDHRVVLCWFQQENDRETLHSMSLDMIRFWEQHPDEETEDAMLRSLYEKGPCSVCRRRVVERLIEKNALPDDLRAECAWDSNSDIRELVRQSP